MLEALTTLEKQDLIVFCVVGYIIIRFMFSLIDNQYREKSKKDEHQVSEMKRTIDELKETVAVLKENVSQFRDIISEIRQDLKSLQGIAQKVQSLEDDLDIISNRIQRTS
jgi:cell shape-determining protein MreC